MVITNKSILTTKHRSKDFKSYLDFRINKIVFLVKNAINPSACSFFFTQHLLPDVKPYHVYFRGMNMTKFITGKQHLTLFSYEVLAILSSEYGWTFRDVRSYFNINFKSKRLKNISVASRKIQDVAPLATKRVSFQQSNVEQESERIVEVVEVTKTSLKRKRDRDLIKDAKTSFSKIDVDEKKSETSVSSLKRKERSSSPSEDPASQKLCSARVGLDSSNSHSGALDIATKQPSASSEGKEVFKVNGLDIHTLRMFSKFANFSAALKLVALNIMPSLRFPQTRFELYYGLMMEGFDENVLLRFRDFLEVRFPQLLTAKALHQVLNEYISFGGVASNDRTVYYHQDISLVQSKKNNWFSKISY